MSPKAILGRILLAALLQLGALAGAKMTPEEIEKVMNVMHRTKVVHIVRKDRDRDATE